MFLSRVLCRDGQIKLALRQGSEAAFLTEQDDLGALALRAAAEGVALSALLLRRGPGDPADIPGLLAAGRLLPPLPAGPVALLPEAMAENTGTLATVPPGAGLGLAAGGTLEGGVAAVFLTAPDGRPLPIGWVQTHAGGLAAGRRILSCGPELCLAAVAPLPAGQTRLTTAGTTLTEFGLPDTDLARATPPVGLAAGTVAVLRPSRWLLRLRADHTMARVETAIPALGLPLANRLGAAADGHCEQEWRRQA